MAWLISLKRYIRVDENLLAQEVSRLEGGKKVVDHAQIKEVQRHLLDRLGQTFKTNPRGVIELLKRHGG